MIKLEFRSKINNKSILLIGGEVFTDIRGDYLKLDKKQIDELLETCEYDDYEVMTQIGVNFIGISFVEKQINGDVRLYLISNIFP